MASSYGAGEATSTVGSAIYTPRSDLTTIDNLRLQDDASDPVPWPGNTYAIVDKDSGRAIYYGKYMGCRGERDMYASDVFGDSEYYVPRRHPNGGYQLLTPMSQKEMKQVVIVSGSDVLVRRQHGGARWEFVKVSVEN
ncbi:hypothetical protein V8C37DRAFT_420642 [Trichoderma ceciliae]